MVATAMSDSDNLAAIVPGIVLMEIPFKSNNHSRPNSSKYHVATFKAEATKNAKRI